MTYGNFHSSVLKKVSEEIQFNWKGDIEVEHSIVGKERIESKLYYTDGLNKKKEICIYIGDYPKNGQPYPPLDSEFSLAFLNQEEKLAAILTKNEIQNSLK